MTTISAWKFNAVRGTGEVVRREAVREKPKAVILSVWRFCEGGGEHVPCP